VSESGLLTDFIDIEPFAKEVGRDVRTVRRWFNQPNGLPHTRMGRRVLIHVPTAREWLLKQLRHRNPRRRAARTE
jgi:hypothetical protein